jgi:hypothetical protein
MVNTKNAFPLKNATLHEKIWKGKNFSEQVGVTTNAMMCECICKPMCAM